MNQQQLLDALADLRQYGVDFLILGQYLQPGEKYLPVVRFVPPEEFDELGQIANVLLQTRDETGVELYYKAAVNPWFEVTADVQVMEPAIRRDATTALVAGLRANIEF